jgi:large subunit ribosomal protein L25
MAESLVLKAQTRQGSGSKDSDALRQQGLIPAVVYGHKEAPLSIAVNARDFTTNLHQGSRLYDIEIDSKPHKLLIKDVQYDHLGMHVLHADFMRVDLSEKVKISVPVELKGTAKGLADGGIVDQIMAQLEVECVVTNIPDLITVNVKELGVGQMIHAGDIKLPAGVTLLTDPTVIVINCHVLAEEKAAEVAEGEAPAGPEVIGRKEKEEAAEGEEKA